MKKLLLCALFATAACSAPEGQQSQENNQTSGAGTEMSSTVAAWEAQAAGITIIRDNWGVPHIYGKTDADAVFGVMYAQGEDDFNRIEINYLNAMGRLAEAEGESEIYKDLRMRLFIQEDEMKRLYGESPEWLKKLMIAYADGLNYY
ncbi:MAG: acylase, partial [Kordiimonadaceae bacterium]|nr:acylase [Kordiimonadaceae bacterium]